MVEDNEGSIHAHDPGVNPILKWFEGFRILRYEQAPSGGVWGNPKNAVYRLPAQTPWHRSYTVSGRATRAVIFNEHSGLPANHPEQTIRFSFAD